MVINWTLEKQAHPEAIRLWNEYAENDAPTESDLAPLLTILREDFPSFCALLLKVRPKGGGYITPFLFNQVQRRIWREMCKRILAGEPLWFIFLKFRQAGMSTFWCAWLFWQIWRQNDVQTLIVAHQDDTAELMIGNFRVFYDELPDVFKPRLRDGNSSKSIPRDECYFAESRSGTTIHLAKNPDPRGGSITHVLETEHASYPDAAGLNKVLLPQLPTFGSEARKMSSVIFESTPKGVNNFHDVYHLAKKLQLGDFRSVFFPWFVFDEQYSAEAPANWRMTDPEKAEQKRLTHLRMQYKREDGGQVPVTRNQMWWRKNTIETDFAGDAKTFDQEYPSDDTTCFMLASKSVFKDYTEYLDKCVHDSFGYATKVWSENAVDGQAIKTEGPVSLKLLPTLVDHGNWSQITNVDFAIHPHGRWTVWAPPILGHQYSIGGDPVIGLSGRDQDFSPISVIDVTEGRQVAEFRDPITLERFAIEMAAAGYWYNTALLVPERNSIGLIVVDKLTNWLAYPNMYRPPKMDGPGYGQKHGYATTNNSKQLLVATMLTNFEDELVIIASRELYNELSVFEQKQQANYVQFGAQAGRHDDCVISFGLALMGIEQTPKLLVEFNRKSHLPSARELGLAGGAPLESMPIPKRLQDLIEIKHSTAWSCFSADLPG